MDYRAKLNASQVKAHLQNIATKIDRDMSRIRSQAEESPTARRRWIWELIQNAKDVHYKGGVRIQVEWYDVFGYLAFKHTGKPFSADNIRFLIEQISTKDRSKDDSGLPTATGRFGTGFLTTHLLSERVTVIGVAKEPELDFKKFRFELDRTGFDLDTIRVAVERAKQSVENLDDLPVYADYDPNAFNTIFEYSISDALGERVVCDGLADVDRCLPYSLVFVPEIRGFEICPDGRTYERIKDVAVGSNSFPQVSIDDPKVGQTVLRIVSEKDSFTSVSLPVEIADGQISILGLSDQIPRLFCDFPLVGTEWFPFPAVINDPNFSPTEPRDGVFLTIGERQNPVAEGNRAIVLRAVDLLITFIESRSHGLLGWIASLCQYSTVWKSANVGFKQMGQSTRVATSAKCSLAGSDCKYRRTATCFNSRRPRRQIRSISRWIDRGNSRKDLEPRRRLVSRAIAKAR